VHNDKCLEDFNCQTFIVMNMIKARTILFANESSWIVNC